MIIEESLNEILSDAGSEPSFGMRRTRDYRIDVEEPHERLSAEAIARMPEQRKEALKAHSKRIRRGFGRLSNGH